MQMRSVLCIASLALASSACNPLEFEDLREEAQVVTLVPPDDYPRSGFGQVVVGYGGTLEGTPMSRVAATAGANTPFSVYPVYIGEQLRLDTPVVDGCDAEIPCMPGAGASLIGLPGWGTREMCVGAIAPESGEIVIRCEDDVTRIVPVPGPGGQRFGASAASVEGDHPFGRAVIGAPGADGGAGAIYRLPDNAPPAAIDLSAATGTGRELGRAVAIAPIDDETVLIAGAASRGATKRVVAATVHVATDGTVTPTVTACIDEAAEGWGEALALGDLDGDGLLDLAVGFGLTEGRQNEVRIYSGAAMPGACASWPTATTLGCPDVTEAECDESAELGVALAIGDLDGDGTGDLLAGAPNATVDDVGGAGAVFVFRGGDLASLSGTDRVATLAHSNPSSGARLGAALAIAPGVGGRGEPVVGSPGNDRLYVFLCSGLDGDSPATTGQMRCDPAAE